MARGLRYDARVIATDRSCRARAAIQALRVIAALVVVTAAASPARAAGFDPTTGRVSLEGAALAVDFESPGRVPVTVYDAGANPQPAVVAEDGPHAIEGQRSLRITGATPLLAVDLDPVREGLIGRRIEIRLWQRPLGTRLTGDLRWSIGDLDRGAITIQPTGAATIDGWVEWTTGPVDFALDGVAPHQLVLYDDQYFGNFDFDPALAVALDAITVLDLGPAAVPLADCRLTTERTTCGPAGVCSFGRCADAAAILGAPLYEPRLRADALARRSFEVATFEGGRGPRARASDFAQRLASIADPATTAVADYWTSLRAVYDALGDGHVSPPTAGADRAVRGGGCAYYSDADLLPDHPIALMLYEATRGHPVGERLRVGDVVRTIDGLPPDTWAQQAARLLEHSGDPAARSAMLAPRLLGVALHTGAVLEVERCPRTGPLAHSPCTAAQVEHIRLDLAEIAAPLLARGEIDSLLREADCDFRFRRPVRDDRGGRSTDYAGSSDTPGPRPIRQIQINSVSGERRWLDAVDRALDAPHPRILLDQRLGTGGTIEAMELLTSRLLSRTDVTRAEIWPPLGITETPAVRSALLACDDGCAGLIPILFDTTSARRGIAATARLAILDGYDISGNDFTAFALTLRRGGPTRIFGPSPTFGAFGPVTTLPRLPGDVYGGSIQTHDTVFLAPGDQHFDFTTGVGVPPTTVLLQRQSDAIRGRDTVLDAARAWLEAE